MPINFVSNPLVRKLALAVMTTCSIWLITLTLLWFTTGRTVPTINVRWFPDTADEQRNNTERELALLSHEIREPNTASYFLLDSEASNLQRIVLHPLVEDTAYINRGTFALEDPPHAHLWIGDQLMIFRSRILLNLSLLGWVTSIAVLLIPRFLSQEPKHS